MRFRWRGSRKRIVAADGSELVPAARPQPDGTLVKAPARAWPWQRLLDNGVYTSVSEIAGAEGIGKSYVSRILRLALLAPDVVEAVVEGSADRVPMLERLERPLPADWAEQRRAILGSDGAEPARAPRGGRHGASLAVRTRGTAARRSWACRREAIPATISTCAASVPLPPRSMISSGGSVSRRGRAWVSASNVRLLFLL